MKLSTNSACDVTDRAMMARCIDLSRIGTTAGELPFGSLIVKGQEVLAQATNETARRSDGSRHAEIVALARARQLLGGRKLRGCTLYSNVEPCPMCSFCIREARIGRVVFALGSPVMGGLSRWNILADHSLSNKIPFVFGAVPEVVPGVLAKEAQQVWRDWNPLAWKVMESRGLLTDPCAAGTTTQVNPVRRIGAIRHLFVSVAAMFR